VGYPSRCQSVAVLRLVISESHNDTRSRRPAGRCGGRPCRGLDAAVGRRALLRRFFDHLMRTASTHRQDRGGSVRLRLQLPAVAAQRIVVRSVGAKLHTDSSPGRRG
jgi:hypothetical protein